MRHDDYNPNDPLFLVSQNLDGDLSESERHRLQTQLAESPALRAEAKRLEAVCGAVRRWGQEGVEVDWKHHADWILASLDNDDGAELKTVDRLLADWGRREPAFDDETFADAVLQRIAPNRHASRATPWVFRLGAPLAAAAAIALAVTASLWQAPRPGAVVDVRIGPGEVQHALLPADQPRVVVSFGRSADDPPQGADAEPGIGYMTVGSSPLPRAWDEPAPL